MVKLGIGGNALGCGNRAPGSKCASKRFREASHLVARPLDYVKRSEYILLVAMVRRLRGEFQMKITSTFEPIRPLAAFDDGCAFCQRAILGNEYRVHYGWSEWPSRSYWIVPGTGDSGV